MKRLSVFLSVFVMIFSFCGCSSGKEIKLTTGGLSFGCNIDYNGDKYSFDVKTFKSGAMDCTVTSPEPLAGMKCLINADSVKTEYKGIEIGKSSGDIPCGAVISLFFSVMSDAGGKKLVAENGDYSVSGAVNGAKYRFFATQGGLPVSVSFEQEKIFMEFVKLALVND